MGSTFRTLPGFLVRRIKLYFVDIRKLKTQLINERRENLNKQKIQKFHKIQYAKKTNEKFQKSSDDESSEKPSKNRRKKKKSKSNQEITDISKAFDNKQTISFSLCNGLRSVFKIMLCLK